jgi:hypothetical protein
MEEVKMWAARRKLPESGVDCFRWFPPHALRGTRWPCHPMCKGFGPGASGIIVEPAPTHEQFRPTTITELNSSLAQPSVQVAANAAQRFQINP